MLFRSDWMRLLPARDQDMVSSRLDPADADLVPADLILVRVDMVLDGEDSVLGEVHIGATSSELGP